MGSVEFHAQGFSNFLFKKKQNSRALFVQTKNMHEAPIYKTDKIKLFWLKQSLQMLGVWRVP